MGVAIIAVILIFPAELIGIFLGEGEAATIATARMFLLYFWPAMLVNGLNIAFSSYFTSLHKAAQSAAIALSRSLALPVVLVLTLSIFLGDVGIFIAIPLAEAATLFLSLFFFSRHRPRKVLAAAGV
jgi:Na+-driven multidrug efflux pump